MGSTETDPEDSRIQQPLYADVIVDITSEDLDRTFQYLVPPRLADRVREGTSVRIPFGPSRVIDGYVVGLGGEAKLDAGRIREIADVLPDRFTPDGNLIRLAAWMRRRYGSTMIRALKTILPVREKRKQRERIYLTLRVSADEAAATAAVYRKKHFPAQADLLEQLSSCSSLEMRETGASGDTVRRLEAKGLIRRERKRPAAAAEDRISGQPGEISGNGAGTGDASAAAGQIRLTAQQTAVRDGILAEWAGAGRPCLIQGVTGSGKTLIYMDLIRSVLDEGKQAIVLIPEISLTWQTVQRFRARFGSGITVLNSRMSAGERADEFERIRSGQAQIAIGPRSALFAPFPRLGLIVIDEEHESSYRSEQTPRYDARETAVARAELEHAHVVMGSATPSVDAWYQALSGRWAPFRLDDRYGGASLPEARVVDMREELASGNRSILSLPLQEAIRERLSRGEQTMLFLNRRGLAGFVSCRSCGFVYKCPHCDVSLTSHSGGKLICHYCGYTVKQAGACPSCGSGHIGGFRAGTQMAEQTLMKAFPEARILRMDADTTKSRDAYEQILGAFAAGEADILVGTQMIVKGHDFANVTLVGILAADLSLYASDYRAAERTYQLLVQALGRAGRREKPGLALVQTYHPDHYSIRAALSQDYDAFYEEEITARELMSYPPAAELLAVHGACRDEALLQLAMRHIAQYLERIRRRPETQIIGPAAEPVAKVQDIWRSVLYLKETDGAELARLRELLEKYIEINTGFRQISIVFDRNR